MAMSTKFKVTNNALTNEEVFQALKGKFPTYKVEAQKALFGQWVQVDQTSLAGVAVRVQRGNVSVVPQNGSFWVRYFFGFFLAYFTSGKLVDEVGGYLKQQFG